MSMRLGQQSAPPPGFPYPHEARSPPANRFLRRYGSDAPLHETEIDLALLEPAEVDEDGRWTAGSAHLALLGDLMDRGPGVTRLLRRLIVTDPPDPASQLVLLVRNGNDYNRYSIGLEGPPEPLPAAPEGTGTSPDEPIALTPPG